MPTETERQQLARLMYLAFCDLRQLGREGRNEQVRALADVFHNVPTLMYTDYFSFTAFRDSLARYQKQHEGQPGLNYLQEWEEMIVKALAQ